jgi:flavodoxin I
MANVGIIYGSTTGNTRDVCQKLLKAFGDAAELHDVTEVSEATFQSYPYLIFATSTWGAGDLQDDWEEYFPKLDSVDLSGKKVAVMGLGDQQNYPDTFVDCVAALVDKARERGAKVVGATSTEGYEYTASDAERDGKFLGLIIDEDNQASQTDQRIKQWTSQLKKQFR